MGQGPDQSVWGEVELFDATGGAPLPNGPKLIRYPRDPNLDNLVRPPGSLALVPEGTGSVWKSNGDGTWSAVGGGDGGGDVTNAANVGEGTGESFRDKTSTILNFRTLLEGSFIEITTLDDEVLFNVEASAGIYDAIVCPPPATGINVYNLLSDAIDAGARHIFLCRGTYNESESIVLPSATNIVGQGKDFAHVKFGAGARFIVDGRGTFTDTGTISLPHGSAAVTGFGTDFLGAGVSTGDLLVFQGIAYPIQEVFNNGALELKDDYHGPALVGYSDWFIMSRDDSIQLTSFRISTVNTTAIEIYNGLDVRITDVILSEGGVLLDRCIDVTLRGMVSVGTPTGIGGFVITNQSGDIRLEGCIFRAPNGYGFEIGGGSNQIQILGCTVWHADLDGFFTDGTAFGLTLDGCGAVGCSGDGFVLDGGRVSANDCRAQENGGNGFVLTGGAKITGCDSTMNVGHGIQIAGGSFTNVTGNTSAQNAGAGVRLEAASTEALVVANSLPANGGGDISNGGATTPLIANNQP
jgi:hypothetical protein